MKLTLLLIIINIAVFLFSVTDFENFIETYGFSVDNFLSGRYETLVTSMFLHAGFIHLASNMVALLFLGAAVESKTKAWQYIIVYFLAGIVGSLSMFVPFFGYDTSTIAVGASAAISGLVGFGTFICPGKFTMFPIIIPIPFIVAGALYFLTTSTLLFVTEEQIAYPAHLFGLFAGAAFGFVWSKERIKSLILFIFTVIFIVALPYILQWALG